MVAADVRHAGRIEANARHPRLAQGVAGNLHHRVGAAVSDHAGQPVGQDVGGRGGQRGRLEFFAVEVAQRAEHPHAMPRARQHAGNQATGRRLAVGAGHADQFQLIAGISGQGLANASVGVSRVGRHAIGQTELRRRPLGEDRRAASGDRLGDEIVAVVLAPRQRDEQRTRLDLPRIADAGRHADVVRADPGGTGQQTTQADQRCRTRADLHAHGLHAGKANDTGAKRFGRSEEK